MSDAPLKDCPSCEQPTLNKKISAAGFRLTRTGWYATDFKDKKPKPEPKKTSTKTEQNTPKTKSE